MEAPCQGWLPNDGRAEARGCVSIWRRGSEMSPACEAGEKTLATLVDWTQLPEPWAADASGTTLVRASETTVTLGHPGGTSPRGVYGDVVSAGWGWAGSPLYRTRGTAWLWLCSHQPPEPCPPAGSRSPALPRSLCLPRTFSPGKSLLCFFVRLPELHRDWIALNDPRRWCSPGLCDTAGLALALHNQEPGLPWKPKQKWPVTFSWALCVGPAVSALPLLQDPWLQKVFSTPSPLCAHVTDKHLQSQPAGPGGVSCAGPTSSEAQPWITAGPLLLLLPPLPGAPPTPDARLSDPKIYNWLSDPDSS